MIAFKYTKKDGAEFLSHLDLLRCIYRTLRRAGARINFSEGYHRHPKIFLNNPLPTGVLSVAEYGAVDCAVEGEFDHIFNTFSPAGVKCLAFLPVGENPNFAATITSCEYFAEGARLGDFAGLDSLFATDFRGREVELKSRILSAENCDGGVKFTALSGENNLRPDLFCGEIDRLFGGKTRQIIKVAAHGNPICEKL